MTFTPVRSLLNHQFEGYKLSFSPSPELAHVPLPYRVTQSHSGTRVLSFQEVASRVRHNHLTVNGDSNSDAIFVAEDDTVTLVKWNEYDVSDKEKDNVSFHIVFRIPKPTSIPTPEPQYPAAVYVTRDMWLVSDGRGYAYLLHINSMSAGEEPTSQLLASWELRDGINTIPFQLHNAALITPHLAIAIVSSSSNTTPVSNEKAQSLSEIWAVRVPLPENPSPSVSIDTPVHVAPFEFAWRRRGTQIPHLVAYVPAREAFVLFGGSSYHDFASSWTTERYEPSPDEIAPIPRVGERLDAHPSPYSWTQTDDTVTITFDLPGTTPKTNIHATFTAQTLSLRVGAPALPTPNYSAAPLWDAINPTSSLWTWESGNMDKTGLLTLHLDKVHRGTRWSHVFAQGFEADIPESLDPSELAGIRESLEKYTASLQEGGGLGQGVPSLAEGERDNEVDATVGTPVVLTWVGNDGRSIRTADDAPAVFLSQPLPGTKSSKSPFTLIIKNDIDGLLYTLDDSGGWKHTGTYSALAFVLASKRDTRFTFHISSIAVLAFESGAREGGGGNVYVYRGRAPGDKWAKQGVFQVRAGAGALLGVGVITSKAGHSILLCLCERELVICRALF